MTKQDFLNELRSLLTGEIEQKAVEEHIRYYEEYISARIRQGEAEEEVLRQLGNPRLIARTIVDADPGETTDARAVEKEYTSSNESIRICKAPSWLAVILVVLAVVSVLLLLILFIWWLAPVILTVWLVIVLIKFLGGAGRK
ncbi:MAG: DUF1700 domain-containing protein [Lachnospiraceae bacterium]|nr:DUF1700 domain-containing protein [Lachnospiraceae bacterium]